MNYTEKIRATIEGLSEEEAKRYLGDIVVNYVLRDQPLTAEDDYIKSINSVLKIASVDELRRRQSETKEITLNIPKLK